MRNNVFAISFLFILFNSSILSAKVPVNKYDFAYLDRRITAWVDSGYYLGASVIIGQGSKAIYKQYYGNYNPQTSRQMGWSSFQLWWSGHAGCRTNG